MSTRNPIFIDCCHSHGDVLIGVLQSSIKPRLLHLKNLSSVTQHHKMKTRQQISIGYYTDIMLSKTHFPAA